MLTRELMTGAPAVVTADETISAAAALMRTRGVGMLPVVDDLAHRRLVGVITDRDIVVRHVALGHGASAKVHEHMTRDPLVTVRPMTPLHAVAEAMTRHQVRRLPVVDDRGTVVGIVAQADLALDVGPHDALLVERVLEGISRPGALVV
jgi:CBS domain-containing protein